jgi:hydrophobe/amphiphile efflux-3 (HAE3) family protein
MYDFLARFIIRHAKVILVICLLVAAYCATHVPRLGFDFTPQQLFRSTSDALDYREEFADRFGREDNLVFVIVESDDGIYDPETLKFIRDVTVGVRELDPVTASDSIATMQIPRAGDSPGVLATTPLVERNGPVSEKSAGQLRELASQEPLVRGQVVSEDGDFTAVMVWIEEEIQDVSVLSTVVDEIATVVEETGPPGDVTWRMGGVPHLRVQIVEELKRQQLTFIPGTAVAYFLVLLILFRRPSGVLGPLGVVGIAVLMTVTLMVWTGSNINIINNVLPSLIFIIAVSDSIHMLVRDAEETEAGAPRKDSVRGMIRHTGAACLLTSTTTAVGFFSLLAADTEILRNFGWQAGSGVLFAYVATLLFLPPLLLFLRPVVRKRLGGRGDENQPWLERALVRVGEIVLDHPWRFIVGGLAIAVVAGVFGSTVKIDTVLLEVYEPGHPSYETTKDLERELSGILPVEISLESSQKDTFKAPELFGKMHAIQEFAEADDVVLGTRSIVDFHQTARVALLGDPDQRDVMPESREQVEQLHLLIAGSPDDETGVNRFVTPDFQHARILLRVRDAGARQQLRLGNDLQEKLDELFAGTEISYRITGDAYVASAALDSFIRDLFVSLMFAMVIIFGMMTVVFRSLRIGLISILPNAIPLVMTFGYMGLANIDLNTTTIIIFAISLGIAVDDTIHFLARFREELHAHPDDVRTAILDAYNGAGRAILITSVMLLIGLVVLLASNFVPTRRFGTLTGITIFGAVLGDLFVLPPILYLIFRRDEEQRDEEQDD